MLVVEGVMVFYVLSECEVGSDVVFMWMWVKVDGDYWIFNGVKCWIINGGKLIWYMVMVVIDFDWGVNGILVFMVYKDDEGFIVGLKECKFGIKGLLIIELYFENCCIFGDCIIGEFGIGFKIVLVMLDYICFMIGV